MKKLNLLALAVVVLFSVSGFSQDKKEISEDKRLLIAKIMKATDAEQNARKSMDAITEEMNKMYPSIIQSTVDSEKDLSKADRDEIVRLLVEKEKAFNKKFNKRIKEELDFGQFIESTFYPLYAKFFTVKELSDLLKFYNSPVGQKFNKISPEFGAETVKLTQEYMLPTIMKIVKEIVDEDIESAKQNADASEGK